MTDLDLLIWWLIVAVKLHVLVAGMTLFITVFSVLRHAFYGSAAEEM